jgi:hypothetical protein
MLFARSEPESSDPYGLDPLFETMQGLRREGLEDKRILRDFDSPRVSHTEFATCRKLPTGDASHGGRGKMSAWTL